MGPTNRAEVTPILRQKAQILEFGHIDPKILSQWSRHRPKNNSFNENSETFSLMQFQILFFFRRVPPSKLVYIGPQWSFRKVLGPGGTRMDAMKNTKGGTFRLVSAEAKYF